MSHEELGGLPAGTNPAATAEAMAEKRWRIGRVPQTAEEWMTEFAHLEDLLLNVAGRRVQSEKRADQFLLAGSRRLRRRSPLKSSSARRNGAGKSNSKTGNIARTSNIVRRNAGGKSNSKIESTARTSCTSTPQ